MGSALGKLQPGPQWSDASLDVEDGSACAISLAEEADSNAEWWIEVRATTDYGTFLVGSGRTRSPASGEKPARLVAVAFYPGAKTFAFSARQIAGTTTRGADVVISSAPGVGTVPGLTMVSSLTRGPGTTRAYPTVAPFAGAPVQLTPRFATLYRAQVGLAAAATANVNVWAALFDSAAAPIAGAQPIWSVHLGQALALASPDPSHAFGDFGPNGLPVTNGLWFAPSDAPGPYVISAVQVHGTFELALP